MTPSSVTSEEAGTRSYAQYVMEDNFDATMRVGSSEVPGDVCAAPSCIPPVHQLACL
jgi:hypothetical protein